jgi:hypothetical protein
MSRHAAWIAGSSPAMTAWKIVLAAPMRPSFGDHYDAISKIGSPPAIKGRRSAERRMPTMSAQQQQALPLADAFQRGCAPPSRARPPSGASPRHSPKACTPMAQPQNRVSSRRGAQGVLPARRMTPRVKHAPCRPVLLPADRCPGAARERIAFHPRAGTASRVHLPKVPSRKAPLVSQDFWSVTVIETFVKLVTFTVTMSCSMFFICF